jgi:hypothetical protein
MTALAEISTERTAQLAKWGSAADDAWSPCEWAALVAHYATRHAVGDLHQVSVADLRSDMVKVGALAVACIEALDRKGL